MKVTYPIRQKKQRGYDNLVCITAYEPGGGVNGNQEKTGFYGFPHGVTPLLGLCQMERE